MSRDPELYQRAKEILLSVIHRPAGERDEILQSLCGDDFDLRNEVRSLLDQAEAVAPIVADGVLGGVVASPAESDSALPESIGPYRVTGLLGEGGMGVVYRARQTAPIKRDVAVKVLRRGLDTDRILERFTWEKRSLARMAHPHIARILDAGSDDSGRPYVAMELIDGEPITHWCDEHEIGLDESIDLMIQVCRAVQHAHDRGVIHRDLKPSNVLVRRLDGRPAPCVIDFGVAKAIDDTDLDLTLAGQRIGTPAYMSPEQLTGRADEVDVRSDVFALGVIFYELLAGVRPYEDERRDEQSAARPPSSRITGATGAGTESGTRGSGVRRSLRRNLRRRLRGDLDHIALMAIRPEAERRYRSADAFASDLERYRMRQPVKARGDNWSYKLGKAIRRHPVWVTLGVALLVIAIGGAGFVGYHVERLEQEQQRALRAEALALHEAASAEEVTVFLEGLFTDVDPVDGGAADATARELLDQGAERIATDLADQPGIRGRLLGVMGRVHHGMGLPERSAELLQSSLEAFAAVEDTTATVQDRATVLASLTNTLHDLGRYAEGEAVSRECLAIYRREHDGPHDDIVIVLADLATLIQAQGRLDEAQQLLEESISMGIELNGPDDPNVAWSRNILGYILYKRGAYHAARDLFEEARASQARTIEGDDMEVVNTLNNLGGINQELGDLDAAEENWTAALDMLQRIFDGDHPAVSRGLHNVARIEMDRGDIEGAAARFEAAHEMSVRVLGPDHPSSSITLASLAKARQQQGRIDEAEAMFAEAWQIRRDTLGDDHALTMGGRESLGQFHLQQGRFGVALDHLAACLEYAEATREAAHPALNRLRLDVAEALLGLQRPDEARSLLETARAHLATAFGEDDARVRRARDLLKQAG